MSLRTLILSTIPTIGDRDATNISRMTSLTALDLSSTSITDRGADCLGACTALEELNLGRCRYISEAWRGPFHLLPKLRTLEIEGRRAIPINAIENIASATALQVLRIMGYTNTQGDHNTFYAPYRVASFTLFAPLVSLTLLDLTGCRGGVEVVLSGAVVGYNSRAARRTADRHRYGGRGEACGDPCGDSCGNARLLGGVGGRTGRYQCFVSFPLGGG
jgi:hypothetical protein